MNPSRVDHSLKCLQNLASLKLPQTWLRSSDSLVWVFFFSASHQSSPSISGEIWFSKDRQHGQAKCVSWPSCSWDKTHQSSQRLPCFVRHSELVFIWFRSQTYCDQLCRALKVAARVPILQQCIWAQGKASLRADLVRLSARVLAWCGQTLGLHCQPQKGWHGTGWVHPPSCGQKRAGTKGKRRSQGKGCG